MGSNGLGFLFSTFIVVIASYWSNKEDPVKLLDLPSVVTVVFGTLGIALISLTIEDIKKIFSMVKVVSRKSSDDRVEIINLFVEMASLARNDITQLAQFSEKIKDPFLKDATVLLSQDFNASSLIKILSRRLEVQRERENATASIFKNLSKYPPACGLLGTVIGMIALLGTLGQEGAAENIGPAMSVALVATLYGVVIANFFLAPMADILQSRTQKSIAKREMIVEGITLLRQKVNPIMIREMLLSHVPPSMRQEIMSGGSA